MKKRRRILIKEEDILRRIERDIELDEQSTQGIRQNREIWHRIFMGLPSNTEDEYSSDIASAKGEDFNVCMPITAMAVNHFHARIIQAIFNQKPLAKFAPTEKYDIQKVEKIAEWFDSWVLNNHIKNFSKWLDEGVQIAAIEGQWFHSAIWGKEERIIRTTYGPFPEIDPMTGLPLTIEEIINNIFGFGIDLEKDLSNIEEIDEDYYRINYRQKGKKDWHDEWIEEIAYCDFYMEEITGKISVLTEKKETIYEGPILKNENFDFIFFPEDVKSLQPGDCPHVIVKYDLTLSQLQSMRNQGIFDISNEQWMEIENLADNYTQESRKFDGTIDEKRKELGSLPEQRSEYDIVHLADCYYSVDINKDGLDEEMLFTVVMHRGTEGHSPVMVIRNKYLDEEIRTGERPIEITCFDIRPYSILGRGLCEKNKPIQEIFNDLWNQLLNYGETIMIPWGFFQQSVGGALNNRDELRLKRGTMLPVEDIQGLYFPQFPNNLQIGAQELQMIYAMFERHTSVNDQIMGRQGGARTATATVRLLGESMQNMALNYRRIAEGLQKRFLSIYKLYKAYMPERMAYRILGPDSKWIFKEITREELVEHPDIYVNIDIESTNKLFQREIYGMLLKAIVMNPVLLQMGIITPRKAFNAAKNMLSAFNQPNISEWLNEPQEPETMIPPEEENYAMAQGNIIHPKSQENHMVHITSHQQFLMNPVSAPWLMQLPERMATIKVHISEHQQLQQQMEMLMRAAMAQSPMQEIGRGGEFFASPSSRFGQGEFTAASGRTLQGMGEATKPVPLTGGLG